MKQIERQEISEEALQLLTESSRVAVEISGMEDEYKEKFRLCVEYQQRVWLPISRISIIIGVILAVIIGLPSHNPVLMSTLVYIPCMGIMIWYMILQFVGKDHKRLMYLEKAISLRIKRIWKPNLRNLKTLSKTTNWGQYQDVYDNILEVDPYIQSLMQWKKIARSLKKTVGGVARNSIKIASVLSVATFILVGAMTSVLNSASENFGPSSSGGRELWINKESGEEFDYDPRNN